MSASTALTAAQLLTQKVLDGCFISFLKSFGGRLWLGFGFHFHMHNTKYWVLGIYIFTSLQAVLCSYLKSMPAGSCVVWLSNAVYSLQSIALVFLFFPPLQIVLTREA